jgi:DNA-binding transcriptional LysR family regulator
MDRLTSLTVFGRVVEAGGFSAAARRLNMSVTMVSNHVQALEDRLGARLLNRTTRKVSLTDIGKAYHDRAMTILAELDEADRIATSQHTTLVGTLRLYTSTHIVRFLSPVVSDFLMQYPAMSIDLLIGERMVDMVEEGFDLAIRTIPPPESSLVVRQLTPWRHIRCCSPGYLLTHPNPAHPENLSSHNCLRYLYYPYGDDWRFEASDGSSVSVRVGGNIQTTSAETLRFLALNSHGVLLAPHFVVGDDLAAGNLVRLLPDYRPVPFSINAVYPHRHLLSLKVRRFLDMTVERFAGYRTWIDTPAAR